MKNKQLTVCFFGAYDKTYTSNLIVMQGLIENGVRVVEVNYHVKVTRLDAEKDITWVQLLKRIIKKYKLIPEIIKNRKLIQESDVLYIGYPGHLEVLFAYVIGKIFRKKIIFFPVIVFYTGFVDDQGILSEKSLRAKILKSGEKLIYSMLDLVLPDTPLQMKHIRDFFGISENKLRVLPIGADSKAYKYTPYTNKSKKVNVVYYGLYTPLHGVEHIIEAAHLLKKDRNVHFTLVGNGNTFEQNYKRGKELKLNNITFYYNTPENEHLAILQKADIFLGFLQKHPTVDRVIPNKVYQGLALGRVVLTADAPVARSVFTHGENIYLCPPSDPKAIAKAITELKNNPEKRAKIAKNGYNLFQQKYTPKAVGKTLLTYIKEII